MPTGKGKLTGEQRGTVDDADEPEKPPKPQANQRTPVTPRKQKPHLFQAGSGTALEDPTVGARAEAGTVTAEEEGGADLAGRAPAASPDPPWRDASFAAASPKPTRIHRHQRRRRPRSTLFCHCTATSCSPSPASTTETERRTKISPQRQLDAVDKGAKA